MDRQTCLRQSDTAGRGRPEPRAPQSHAVFHARPSQQPVRELVRESAAAGGKVQCSAIGWLTVGSPLCFKAANGERSAAVLCAVHTDDPPTPYYTIRLEDTGAERQTTAERLEPRPTRPSAPRRRSGHQSHQHDEREEPVSAQPACAAEAPHDQSRTHSRLTRTLLDQQEDRGEQRGRAYYDVDADLANDDTFSVGGVATQDARERRQRNLKLMETFDAIHPGGEMI